MKLNIKWADFPGDNKDMMSKSISPFDNQQWKRPVRITFHNQSLKKIDRSEKVALELLLEFAKVESPNLSALSTEKGDLNHIEIEEQKNSRYIPLIVKYSEGHSLRSGIMFPQQLPQLANYMVDKIESNPTKDDYNESLQDITIAMAHRSIHHDILVTSSKWLLGDRETGFIKDVNPYLPSETLKIVGLLFRIRDDFRYAGRTSFDRGLFYWVLVRYKLPAMWRYFSACVYSEASRGDDIAILGQSILVRCERALQAQDQIGKLFYVEQDNNTRDEALYHFDYLMLLLSGALDAQARISYRTYKIADPKNERDASFRKSDFVDEIGKVDTKLADYLRSDYFKDITKIISKMRNTIHGAGLTSMSYQGETLSEKSFIKIPDADGQLIWDICEKYNLPDNWGLFKLPNMILFEQYSFSQNIIKHTLEIVNTIAQLTQVEKLFPEGVTIPDLKSSPPEDDKVFSSIIGERLNLLF